MHVIRKIKKRARYYFGQVKKIDFMVVGAQKAGTTALDSYLRLNPQICMATKKEVHFFDNDTFFANGNPDYRTYHSYFNPSPSHKLLGEVTPAYMYWLTSPRRIWEYNLEIKLIAVLRNPIDRAYSQWNMQIHRKRDTRTFWEAIHSEPEKIRETLPLQNRPYAYIDRGFYSEQIRRLKLYFPEDQILIIRYEELLEAPHTCLNNIWSFLGVDGLDLVDSLSKNQRPYVSEMEERERDYLKHVFEYEIKHLERMLGWDCSGWLQ